VIRRALPSFLQAEFDQFMILSRGSVRSLLNAALLARDSDELERAKTRLIAEAVYAEDNQATLARWYGSALAIGQTVEDVRAWPDRIRAVTADTVQNAARAWLDRRHSVTGYLVKSLQSEEKRS